MSDDTALLAGLQRAGAEAFPGFRLRAVATTSSTQDVVRAAAREGAQPGFSCLAAAQSAGRGRQDRQWIATAGSALLCSVLVRVDQGLLGGVPLAAGLAVRAAIAATSGYQARLKWPNDILGDNLKLAGVLCELEPLAAGGSAAGADAAVAVGVGVNLRVAEFPAGVPGVSLHTLCAEPPPPATLFGAFLAELADRLDRLKRSGSAELHREWLEHATGIGETVTVQSGAGSVSGVAEGLDDDGALLVRTRGGVVRLLAGDVHIGLGGRPR
ncbi:MAG: biotin--[acetyl-CoA-carboxylase] ligase [Candidatus Dormibacteraeota bacterium]|uniref:biotin--[biotin carboxyl-carrier protein] ligase n=1 Tax=Candidatus Amunia macphersoniae TaxID=3127014 RepID=A0A934NH62_9BACT|nr:biotin--[acetyl-CoA-carboxylase] ligase [Candidatus Dormibacteraeota bacterium]